MACGAKRREFLASDRERSPNLIYQTNGLSCRKMHGDATRYL
jgi:hypothetical protein